MDPQEIFHGTTALANHPLYELWYLDNQLCVHTCIYIYTRHAPRARFREGRTIMVALKLGTTEPSTESRVWGGKCVR